MLLRLESILANKRAQVQVFLEDDILEQMMFAVFPSKVFSTTTLATEVVTGLASTNGITRCQGQTECEFERTRGGSNCCHDFSSFGELSMGGLSRTV